MIEENRKIKGPGGFYFLNFITSWFKLRKYMDNIRKYILISHFSILTTDHTTRIHITQIIKYSETAKATYIFTHTHTHHARRRKTKQQCSLQLQQHSSHQIRSGSVYLTLIFLLFFVLFSFYFLPLFTCFLS